MSRKIIGNMPNAPDTMSINQRALTPTVRTPSVWPHCLGKKKLPSAEFLPATPPQLALGSHCSNPGSPAGLGDLSLTPVLQPVKVGRCDWLDWPTNHTYIYIYIHTYIYTYIHIYSSQNCWVFSGSEAGAQLSCGARAGTLEPWNLGILTALLLGCKAGLISLTASRYVYIYIFVLDPFDWKCCVQNKWGLQICNTVH